MYLHKLRFIQLRYYHNHAHISITFSLNFFLPPLSFALLSVVLSALVLKLPLKVLFVLDRIIKLLTSGQLLFVSQFEIVCLETPIHYIVSMYELQ